GAGDELGRIAAGGAHVERHHALAHADEGEHLGGLAAYVIGAVGGGALGARDDRRDAFACLLRLRRGAGGDDQQQEEAHYRYQASRTRPIAIATAACVGSTTGTPIASCSGLRCRAMPAQPMTMTSAPCCWRSVLPTSTMRANVRPPSASSAMPRPTGSSAAKRPMTPSAPM